MYMYMYMYRQYQMVRVLYRMITDALTVAVLTPATTTLLAAVTTNCDLARRPKWRTTNKRLVHVSLMCTSGTHIIIVTRFIG